MSGSESLFAALKREVTALVFTELQETIASCRTPRDCGRGGMWRSAPRRSQPAGVSATPLRTFHITMNPTEYRASTWRRSGPWPRPSARARSTPSNLPRLNALLPADEDPALCYATYLRMHGACAVAVADQILIHTARRRSPRRRPVGPLFGPDVAGGPRLLLADDPLLVLDRRRDTRWALFGMWLWRMPTYTRELAKSPARPPLHLPSRKCVGRPDHRHGRLPLGRSANRAPLAASRRFLGPDVLPGRRDSWKSPITPALRSSPGTMRLSGRIRQQRLPLAGQADREGGEGGRGRETEKEWSVASGQCSAKANLRFLIPNPQSLIPRLRPRPRPPSPSSPSALPLGGDRPRHGVRLEVSEQGKHDFARLSRLGEGASGRRQRPTAGCGFARQRIRLCGEDAECERRAADQPAARPGIHASSFGGCGSCRRRSICWTLWPAATARASAATAASTR